MSNLIQPPLGAFIKAWRGWHIIVAQVTTEIGDTLVLGRCDPTDPGAGIIADATVIPIEEQSWWEGMVAQKGGMGNLLAPYLPTITAKAQALYPDVVPPVTNADGYSLQKMNYLLAQYLYLDDHLVASFGAYKPIP